MQVNSKHFCLSTEHVTFSKPMAKKNDRKTCALVPVLHGNDADDSCDVLVDVFTQN